MKIRTKLLLALSALPILILITIGIGWYQVSSFNKMNEDLQETYDLSIIAEEIHTDIHEEEMRIRNILLSNGSDSMLPEINKMEAASGRVSTNIASLEARAFTPEQKELINELSSTNVEFNVFKEQIIDLATSGNLEQATNVMNENATELNNDFQELIADLTTTFESDMYSSLQTVMNNFTREMIVQSVVIGLTILIIMSLLLRSIWLLSSRLRNVSNEMYHIANGDVDAASEVEVLSNDEIDEVAKSFNQMAKSVEEQRNREQELTWTKTHIADVTTSMTGSKTVESLLKTFLSKVVPLVNGSHAVFYVKDDQNDENNPSFKLRASYAFKDRKHMTNEIKIGEGIIGQAALEKEPIILSNVPTDYVSIQSGLGEASPLSLYVMPIIFEDEVKAVLEIASFESFSDSQRSLIEELSDDLGIMLESVQGRFRLAKALEESQALTEEVQAQSEELQIQQDELKTTNEELEQQTMALRESEEKLQEQQEELEQANVELEEKANSLEEQNKRFEEKNKELISARAELEERAQQLALSSKYKSEFLANMSHELRTPLNSMLILSNLLAENSNKALSPKQVEYANTIYSSGRDLLTLINDILDLSKIESGKMDVHPSHILLRELTDFVENNFRPVADKKNVQFEIELASGLPDTLFSDEIKVQQVLKNLLSNAFKFTKKGKVVLRVDMHDTFGGKPTFAFSVQDTGIGISEEKQEQIFEAFQQADGTTSRKYGGTGLGLSISKEIATLLGGSLTVESQEGKGSTFTFYVSDFDGTAEVEGPLWADELAGTVEPESNGTGNTVVKPEALVEVAQLEPEPEEEENSHIKRLLIVDDDLNQRNSLLELVGEMNVIIKAVSTGNEAIKELNRNAFDCVVLDLGLTDTTGFELLEQMMELEENENLKVIVYTGRDLTPKEERYLNKYTHTIIIKDEHSPQRLKEELELYLNGDKTDLSTCLEHVQEDPNTAKTDFKGKKVLLVDDDIRNVYALSSILEVYGMDIIFAENGLEGLEIMNNDPGVDLILMDIMMPEMDGYEAISRIREIPAYQKLPIIALTAKAMREDREKSLEVGASDYIVKPINPDQLISLIKVWLFQQDGNEA
ncbi:response regulator [Oceanobacillus limi]|uniref:response regulator n=1 Tax=Oceanobacillus limi TaxID=930131 RepID=UPI00147BB634|nr:response regulator [Oceanobacillus limi]